MTTKSSKKNFALNYRRKFQQLQGKLQIVKLPSPVHLWSPVFPSFPNKPSASWTFAHGESPGVFWWKSYWRNVGHPTARPTTFTLGTKVLVAYICTSLCYNIFHKIVLYSSRAYMCNNTKITVIHLPQWTSVLYSWVLPLKFVISRDILLVGNKFI